MKFEIEIGGKKKYEGRNFSYVKVCEMMINFTIKGAMMMEIFVRKFGMMEDQ